MKATQPKRKARKLPPGQRLLRYIGLSSILLLALGGSTYIHLGPKAVGGETGSAGSAEAAIAPPPITLTQDLDQLQSKLVQCAAVKALKAGIFVTDQSTGRYVNVNGHDAFPAASMIKLPVYVALLEAIDRGTVKPDQMLEIRQDLVTGGSGWLQWRPVGSKISVRDTAELMIIISDNTATNMIIDLLGGKEACNREFQNWGLERTHIANWLGDFEGTNTTSPYDLVYLLARVDRGELISPDSKKWMYQVMGRTKIRTLLPPGLGPGAKIAHKTGDIGCMVGDVGIVTAPTGQKYFVSVQVQRPHNDRRANLLIRGLSRMIYQCFSTPTADGAQIAELPGDCQGGTPAGPGRPVHHSRHHHHHA